MTKPPMLIGGWNFSPGAAAPDFARVNPLSGLKRIFSANSLAELFKALLKFLLIAATLVELKARRLLPGDDDVDLDEYHTRWARAEAAGRSSHGEADLVMHYAPSTVLDAGCGMGRVGIELDRRGVAVQGVDLDEALLEYARADAPHVPWHRADLASAR